MSAPAPGSHAAALIVTLRLPTSANRQCAAVQAFFRTFIQSVGSRPGWCCGPWCYEFTPVDIPLGHKVAVMKTFTVTTDSNGLDIVFRHTDPVLQNPLINAIEILAP